MKAFYVRVLESVKMGSDLEQEKRPSLEDGSHLRP